MMVMANMELVRLGSRMEATARASSRAGTDRKMSAIRMMRVSTQVPFMYPASRPRQVPTGTAITSTRMAIFKAPWKEKMIRLRISRPMLSVPRRNWAQGALVLLAKSV